ncbi:MAG TPA: cytosine permease, partial [Gaiellales bacterium]|nr:cytosine permease [Gaiellales bacterium]
MVHKSDAGSSALEASTFGGRMPSGAGDLAIETHGITPVPEDNRYGTPRRLFTVWFAPQMNMTGVFTGSLAIVFGLGFWLGLLAMVIGTLLGSLPVAYLSTWGPRTGTGQLPAARMAFGATVVLPAIVQWLSSIAWDGLVGLFGGEALSTLLHIPFWVGVLIVLALQGAVGIFGYELIHRVEAVMTVVLVIMFAVLTIKLLSGNHQIVTPPTVHHGDLVGSFILEVTVALSLAISWASYASDYSRYLPPSTPRKPVFWYSMGGIVLGYIAIQAIGIAGAKALGAETAAGVRDIMGGGFLGALALVVIALASVGSNVMNDYSGSLALQTVGVRVRRPISALVVTVIAFFLILWMHGGNTSSRFENVLLFVGYWIPAFVAIVTIDWYYRARGRHTVNPARESTVQADAIVALITFVVAFGASVPFMDTSIIVGPVAKAWHGADVAYFVNFGVAAIIYGAYRVWRH